MELKASLSKEDWEKTLREANNILRDAAMTMVVVGATVDLARAHIKRFPAKDQEKSKATPQEKGKAAGQKWHETS